MMATVPAYDQDLTGSYRENNGIPGIFMDIQTISWAISVMNSVEVFSVACRILIIACNFDFNQL